MKRNVLLSAVTLMMTANVFAQAEDVTPAAFKFQERSVGPVEMFWGTGANHEYSRVKCQWFYCDCSGTGKSNRGRSFIFRTFHCE